MKKVTPYIKFDTRRGFPTMYITKETDLDVLYDKVGFFAIEADFEVTHPNVKREDTLLLFTKGEKYIVSRKTRMLEVNFEQYYKMCRYSNPQEFKKKMVFDKYLIVLKNTKVNGVIYHMVDPYREEMTVSVIGPFFNKSVSGKAITFNYFGEGTMISEDLQPKLTTEQEKMFDLVTDTEEEQVIDFEHCQLTVKITNPSSLIPSNDSPSVEDCTLDVSSETSLMGLQFLINSLWIDDFIKYRVRCDSELGHTSKFLKNSNINKELFKFNRKVIDTDMNMFISYAKGGLNESN